MFKHLFLFLFAAFLLTGTIQLPDRGDALEQFLDTSGRKTTWEYVNEMSPFFIESRTDGQQVRWLQGSFETSSGEVFEEVALKFNTLDNALFLRHRKGLYKLPAQTIKRFSVEQDGKQRRFEKGFELQSEQVIEFVARCGVAHVMSHLLAAPDTSTFDIVSIEVAPQSDATHTVSLTLTMAGTKRVYDLQRHLVGSTCLTQINMLSTVPDVDESRLMEILSENRGLQLAKLHLSRAVTSETLSLSKHSATHAFTDERYFLADETHRAVEIKRFKGSIRHGLEMMNIKPQRDMPNVSSEKRLILWFESSKM